MKNYHLHTQFCISTVTSFVQYVLCTISIGFMLKRMLWNLEKLSIFPLGLQFNDVWKDPFLISGELNILSDIICWVKWQKWQIQIFVARKIHIWLLQNADCYLLNQTLFCLVVLWRYTKTFSPFFFWIYYPYNSFLCSFWHLSFFS